jgi:demethylmenaquinone methyltransferase / 2-methoxy-6-polyprenyl-1,4-benzoquinol methylase
MSESKSPKETHVKFYPHSGLEIAHRFFAGTAPSYNLTVHLWTLGLDWWWKKRIIDKIPRVAQLILDQGCGTGILTFRMARRFPTSRVIGVELHQDYISLAAKKAKALGLNNVKLIIGRAEDVVLRDRFDCITSSYLSKYAEMGKLIRGAKKMLREGGLLIMHDFTYPRNRLVACSLGIYFRMMQTFGRFGFPEWENAFYELEDYIRQSSWVADLISSLERQGFANIRIERLTLGFATIVSAKNKI